MRAIENGAAFFDFSNVESDLREPIFTNSREYFPDAAMCDYNYLVSGGNRRSQEILLNWLT
jgi:hypothetical protein